jgi:hypothetical protein
MPKGKGGGLVHSEAEFIEAVPGSYGILTNIAKRIGCDQHTVLTAKKRYSAFRKALIVEELALKDLGEGQLIENLKKGDIVTCIFFNKTKNRDRGYEEKARVGIQGDMSFTFKWEGEGGGKGKKGGSAGGSGNHNDPI